MHTSELPRTAESLRSETFAQFEALYSPLTQLGLSEAEAKRKLELSMQTLDLALTLDAGQVLDLASGLGWHEMSDPDRKLMLDAAMVLCGQPRLLKMEFAHDTLGTLPPSVAQAVLMQNEPYLHHGVELTKDGVKVQWRRLPL